MIGEPGYWGRGLGKLTVREMLRIAFEDEKWERFWGHFAAWNHRSIALHQSFGMTLAGKADHRRRHIDGTEHDMLILAIRRETWEANPACAVPAKPPSRNPEARGKLRR